MNKSAMIDELNDLKGNGLLRLEVIEEKTKYFTSSEFSNFYHKQKRVSAHFAFISTD